MDIVTPILTASLSRAAGFNAYMPLRIVALAARFTDLVKLSLRTIYDELVGHWRLVGIAHHRDVADRFPAWTA